jgi:hypothetical protein
MTEAKRLKFVIAGGLAMTCVMLMVIADAKIWPSVPTRPQHVRIEMTDADIAEACRVASASAGRIYEGHPCTFQRDSTYIANRPFNISPEAWAASEGAEFSGIATVRLSDSPPDTNILEYVWGSPVQRALWPSSGHQVHVSKIDGTWRKTISRKNGLTEWSGAE